MDQSAPTILKREFSSVLDSSRTKGAIRGRMPDMGKNNAADLLQQIDQWITKQQPDSTMQITHTGTHLMLDLVNDLQISAMFKGLLLAIFCIGIIMALIFWNWKLVGVTILVNLVPLLIVAGCMGFLGIELRGGTSIVFTIAFVIAVDDTIHFLNNVSLRIKRGLSRSDAIKETLQKTGQPIFITSIVMLLAFLLLVLSVLGNVKYLGILVSLTIVFALLSDLLLAPLCLKGRN